MTSKRRNTHFQLRNAITDPTWASIVNRSPQSLTQNQLLVSVTQEQFAMHHTAPAELVATKVRSRIGNWEVFGSDTDRIHRQWQRTLTREVVVMMISAETNGKMTVNYELKGRNCRGLF